MPSNSCCLQTFGLWRGRCNADGINALAKAAELTPDVVLLDLSIPRLHGMEVAKSLKKDFADLRVILMSERDASALNLRDRPFPDKNRHFLVSRPT